MQELGGSTQRGCVWSWQPSETCLLQHLPLRAAQMVIKPTIPKLALPNLPPNLMQDRALHADRHNWMTNSSKPSRVSTKEPPPEGTLGFSSWRYLPLPMVFECQRQHQRQCPAADGFEVRVTVTRSAPTHVTLVHATPPLGFIHQTPSVPSQVSRLDHVEVAGYVLWDNTFLLWEEKIKCWFNFLYLFCSFLLQRNGEREMPGASSHQGLSPALSSTQPGCTHGFGIPRSFMNQHKEFYLDLILDILANAFNAFS